MARKAPKMWYCIEYSRFELHLRIHSENLFLRITHYLLNANHSQKGPSADSGCSMKNQNKPLNVPFRKPECLVLGKVVCASEINFHRFCQKIYWNLPVSIWTPNGGYSVGVALEPVLATVRQRPD